MLDSAADTPEVVEGVAVVGAVDSLWDPALSLPSEPSLAFVSVTETTGIWVTGLAVEGVVEVVVELLGVEVESVGVVDGLGLVIITTTNFFSSIS